MKRPLSSTLAAEQIGGKIIYSPPDNDSLTTSYSAELSVTIKLEEIRELINQAKNNLVKLRQTIKIR